MSIEELNELATRVKERFISRMRGIYGETDEFEQWADALDVSDDHPGDPRAKDFARAALHQLIKTKYPEWGSETSPLVAPLLASERI